MILLKQCRLFLNAFSSLNRNLKKIQEPPGDTRQITHPKRYPANANGEENFYPIRQLIIQIPLYLPVKTFTIPVNHSQSYHVTKRHYEQDIQLHPANRGIDGPSNGIGRRHYH